MWTSFGTPQPGRPHLVTEGPIPSMVLNQEGRGYPIREVSTPGQGGFYSRVMRTVGPKYCQHLENSFTSLITNF